MLRKIIKIDEEKCNGCGACATACHEGAIEIIGGKAKLTKEEYCDGLGDCLPACPVDAISFEEKEAPLSFHQWPVQIKLVPIQAPFFDQSHLLIAADCTAYAYGNFHQAFMENRITLIGCPKLDAGDYAEKLAAIIAKNEIRSVTVVRMEVPCCGGIEYAVKRAIQASGKELPWRVVTISIQGNILDK